MQIQFGIHIRKNITAIKNVQRGATKLIPGSKDLSYEARLRKLKLPTLSYRCSRGNMIEVFKLTTGKYDKQHYQHYLTQPGILKPEDIAKKTIP